MAKGIKQDKGMNEVVIMIRHINNPKKWVKINNDLNLGSINNPNPNILEVRIELKKADKDFHSLIFGDN